jgi:hypothetical protein
VARGGRMHLKKNMWLDPHKTWNSECAELWERVKYHKVAVTAPALFVVLWVLFGSASRALLIESGLLFAAFVAWTNKLSRRAGRQVSWGESWRFLRRRRKLIRGWDMACETLNAMGRRGVMKGRTPALRDVHLGPDGSVRAITLCGPLGVTPDDLREAAPRFGHAMLVREVEVGDLRPGWATLVFRDGDALDKPVTPSSMPSPPAQVMSRGEYVPPTISLGVAPSGALVPVSLSTSVLFGGASGSGKSSGNWALLAALIQQRIPVRLRIADPAGGVEFALLKEFMGRSKSDLFTVHRYAETPAEVKDMIREQAEAMRGRLRSMSGSTRWHQPTPEEPLDLLIIDEMLRVPELKKQQDGDLGEILTIGRKAAFLVWGNVQVAKVSTIGDVRDMFAQRVCLRVLTGENVVSVLGDPGSRVQAPAHLIPKTQAGTGYVYDDTRGTYAKFRAPYMNDQACRAIAQGLLPPGMDGRQPKERTALYRWYAADDTPGVDRPSYIGISYDVLQREAQHVAGLREFMEGDVRRTVQWYASREEAEAAEKAAIVAEQPTFNIAHNARRRRKAATAA